MAQQVTAPVRQPRAGGIKSVVPEFIREPRLAVVNAAGGLAWEDSGCGFPALTRAGCYDDALPDADKDFDGYPEQYTTIAQPFAQYAGVGCFLGGDADGSSYKEQAETLLIQGEHRGIEQALAGWATSASGGGASDLTEAIALADLQADEQYVGRPIMLMNRRDVVRAVASGTLTRVDGVLVTGNGTPVVGIGFLPNGYVAVVGAIAIYASDVITALAPTPNQNYAVAMAERVYAIGVDCGFRYFAFIQPA